MKEDLEKERFQGTTTLRLDAYVGTFHNKIKTLSIEAKLEGDRLHICFQGNHKYWYPTEHFENDIFTWVLTRDENVELGRFLVTWRNFYKIKFQRDKDDRIRSLIWENDGAWEDGEVFTRDKDGLLFSDI